MKKLLWIVALTFSMILGQTALADSDKCGDKLHKMVENLHLDKDQQAKLQPIVDQFKATVKDNWTQMRDIRKQISEQVLSDKMDQATVDGLIDKKTQLMGNIIKARVSAMNQISTILKPEQKTKLHDTMKKWEEKMAAKYESCKEGDND